MAEARNHLRQEIRVFLFIGAAAFALGLILGFSVLRMR